MPEHKYNTFLIDLKSGQEAIDLLDKYQIELSEQNKEARLRNKHPGLMEAYNAYKMLLALYKE